MKKKKRKGRVPKAVSAARFHRQRSPASNQSHHDEKRPVSEYASGPPEARKAANKKMVETRYVEDAMRESHAIAQALMNASQDAVVILDGDGAFLDANAMVCKRLGISRELLVGKPFWKLFPAQMTKRRKEAFEEAHKTLEIVRFEDERDGRYYDHVVYPVLKPNGSLKKFVIVGRDITERVKIEKALKENEERFWLAVERTSDMVSLVTFSVPPSYVYINPSYHVILGYKPEDLLGKGPFDLLYPEDSERLITLLRRYLNAKSQGSLARGGKGPTERLLYRLKDAWGNWRYLEGTADLMGEEHILMVSRDVSARIKTELDLERARKKLEENMEERTRELKMNSESLEETNVALKVLLEMRERDKKELERSVTFNVRQIMEPYLEKLKNSGLNEKQKGCLDLLKSSVEELVLPFSRDLVVSEMNLTPSQVRVANLIRFGKSSKEIAEALGVSLKTVETHRRRIRAKLGLTKTKANLQSHLVHLSNPR